MHFLRFICAKRCNRFIRIFSLLFMFYYHPKFVTYFTEHPVYTLRPFSSLQFLGALYVRCLKIFQRGTQPAVHSPEKLIFKHVSSLYMLNWTPRHVWHLLKEHSVGATKGPCFCINKILWNACHFYYLAMWKTFLYLCISIHKIYI